MALKQQFERGAPWPEIGGYVDGITDNCTRHDKYTGFYVDQSFQSPVHVSIEYDGEIRTGNTRTLHYFTLTRGQGHRHAHSLRLWGISDPTTDRLGSVEKARFLPLQDVLEMIFCRAFEPLLRTILTQFLVQPTIRTLGLNNLPPWFQD